MENKEQKATPTTFRITSTTNDKFKELAQSFGFTQEEMLSNLISTYELENAKALIINREKEIAEFQSHVSRLVNIYLNSLELNQNSETRIHEKYSEQLNTKVEMINLLQNKIAEMKDNVENQNLLLTNTLNENAKLTDEVDNLKDTLGTKEKLIKEYIEKIDTFSSLITEYTEYKNDYMKLKDKLDSLSAEKEEALYNLKQVELENINLEKRVELLLNQIQDNKDNLLQIKTEYKENLAQIKSEHSELIKTKNLELERASKELFDQLQALTLKHENEASRLNKTHMKEITQIKAEYKENLNRIQNENVKELKVLEERLIIEHNNNLETLKLNYEKQLFEKDKELNKFKNI